MADDLRATVAEIIREFDRSCKADDLSCELVEFINELSDSQFCELVLAESKYAINFLQLRENDLYQTPAQDKTELDERMVQTTGPIILSLYKTAEELDQSDILLLANHRIPPVIGRYSIYDFTDPARRRDCAITYYRSFYPDLLLSKKAARYQRKRISALPENLDRALANFVVKGTLDTDDDANSLRQICSSQFLGEYVPFSDVLSGEYTEWIATEEDRFSPFLQAHLCYVLHNLELFLKSPLESPEDAMVETSYPRSTAFIKANFPPLPHQGFNMALWRALHALSDATALKRMFDHGRWEATVNEEKGIETIFKGLREARNRMLKLRNKQPPIKLNYLALELIERTTRYLDAFEIARSILHLRREPATKWDEFDRKSFLVLFPLFTRYPRLPDVFKMLKIEEEEDCEDGAAFSVDLVVTYGAATLFNRRGDPAVKRCDCSFIKTRSAYESKKCPCLVADDDDDDDDNNDNEE